MRYDEAFKIGTKIEGYVKCAYAEVWLPKVVELDFAKEKFDKAFALQGQHYRTNQQKADWEEELQKMQGVGYMSEDADVINFVTEIPVAVATERVQYQKGERVPVKLTKQCRETIIKKINKPNYWQNKYFVYKVYTKDQNGKYLYDENGNFTGTIKKGYKEKVYEGWQKPDMTEYKSELNKLHEEMKPDMPIEAFVGSGILLGKSTKCDYFYKMEYKREVNDTYYALIEAIKADATFYVKPCALDWVPMDVTNMTYVIDGVALNLDDALALAYKKMQNAKHLCIGAGLTTLI